MFQKILAWLRPAAQIYTSNEVIKMHFRRKHLRRRCEPSKHVVKSHLYYCLRLLMETILIRNVHSLATSVSVVVF